MSASTCRAIQMGFDTSKSSHLYLNIFLEAEGKDFSYLEPLIESKNHIGLLKLLNEYDEWVKDNFAQVI